MLLDLFSVNSDLPLYRFCIEFLICPKYACATLSPLWFQHRTTNRLQICLCRPCPHYLSSSSFLDSFLNNDSARWDELAYLLTSNANTAAIAMTTAIAKVE